MRRWCECDVRILVTGATGRLGRDMVLELAGRGHDVTGLGHQDMDVSNLQAVRERIADLRPEAVVNCAAYTRADDAEKEKALAFAANALGPRNLALSCREEKAALLHISSDYVFDGEKSGPYTIWDQPSPLNVYGVSKLWGENYVRSLLAEYYLVRTSWLFGPHGRNFVDTMIEMGRDRFSSVEVSVVADQRGSPTYTVDLAKACADLLETGCFGIYHVTNQGVVTRYEFAKTIFQKVGLPVEVRATSSEEFATPARRPKNSELDPFPLAETIGYLLPPWEDALTRYLEQKTLQTQTPDLIDSQASPHGRQGR